jgi:hypothetical protein
MSTHVKNNEKIIKKSIPLRFEDMGAQKVQLISFILNIKKYFDYLSFTSQ